MFGPLKDLPKEGYFHVHHPAGKGKDPFFTQLASWDANKAEWRPRTQLMSKIKGAKDFGAKRKVVEEFIENIPEGIQTQPGKKIYGKDLSLSEKLRVAGKEADLLRSKNFVKWIKTFPCLKGEGGSPDIDCHIKGLHREKNLLVEGKGSKVIANKFIEGTNLARKTGNMRALLGIGGVFGDVLFEGAYAAYNYMQGMDAAEIWKHSWYSFMDPSMWKDGKYIGWVADAEKVKTYTREDGSIIPEIKRYVDNVDKLQTYFDLQEDVFDAENLDTRGYDRTKYVAQAKTKLSDFTTRLNLEGGEGKLSTDLQNDQRAYSEREEVMDARKVQKKIDRFEELKAKGVFSEDQEFLSDAELKKLERRRQEEFLEYRGAEPRTFYKTDPEGKPLHYTTDSGRKKERIEDPSFGVPGAYKEVEDTLSSTSGYMSPEHWKEIQVLYPELKDVAYEDLSEKERWGEYMHYLKQKIPGATKTIGEMTTPADRYGWDLTGKVAEAGGISNIAEGGRVSYFNGGIAGLLKK